MATVVLAAIVSVMVLAAFVVLAAVVSSLVAMGTLAPRGWWLQESTNVMLQHKSEASSCHIALQQWDRNVPESRATLTVIQVA